MKITFKNYKFTLSTLRQSVKIYLNCVKFWLLLWEKKNQGNIYANRLCFCTQAEFPKSYLYAVASKCSQNRIFFKNE